MNIVGKDGFFVPGVEFNRGVLVKSDRIERVDCSVPGLGHNVRFIRHTERPIPENQWDAALAAVSEERSYLVVDLEDAAGVVDFYRFITSRWVVP